MKRIFIAHSPTPSVREFVARLSEELRLAGLEPLASSEAVHEFNAMGHTSIRRADLVIGVITDPNPNVFFEIGCAVGSGRKVLLVGAPSVEMPFDLKSYRYVKAPNFGLETVFQVAALVRELHDDVSNEVAQYAGFRDILQTYRTDPGFFESVAPEEFEDCIFEWCNYRMLMPVRPEDVTDAGYEFELQRYNGHNRTLVDCKKYGRNSRVSVGHVQRLLGVMIGYGGDHAIMIATSPYTRSAIDFASKCEPKIELWDMDRLLDDM